MSKKTLLQSILSLMLFISIMACSNSKRIEAIDNILNQAEHLMENHPDSSLLILNEIDNEVLKDRHIKARYALLKSMALDKNYIDATTFDVLQPAIDYYLKNGNADEKLRTYYYQGVIYNNSHDYDNAMHACLNAFAVKGNVCDSLTLARLLAAQATLFYSQYRIADFLSNNLKAGKIFGSKGKTQQQLRCYLKALNGATILNDKSLADSVKTICDNIIQEDPRLKKISLRAYLVYTVKFGNIAEIKNMINVVEENDIFGDVMMNLAQAYAIIGEPNKGLLYLNEAGISQDNILDSLTYWSIKSDILEKMNDDKGALDAFKNYSRVLEIYHDRLFSNDLLFSEKKHEMEIESLGQIHKRDNLIKWILAGTAILLVLIVFFYYRYRMSRAARLIAEQNSEKLKLEAEKLQLESDNLHLELENLEDERERLSSLLQQKDTLSDEMLGVIRERLDMLNGLLAKEITNEESYAKPFRKHIELLKKDHKKFQDSTRKYFQAAYPKFMAYLIAHGLTEKEINYVCLYALGLRGKEVGNYLDTAVHYNISSVIRHKLGLDSNGSNLGPYIRQLLKDL